MHCLFLYYLYLAVLAKAHLPEGEECNNPGSTLNDAFVQDHDLPLSLIQKTAQARRNNNNKPRQSHYEHRQNHQYQGQREQSRDQNNHDTHDHPRAHQLSGLADATPNTAFSTEQGHHWMSPASPYLPAPYLLPSPYLYTALYFALSVAIVASIVHFSLLHAHEQVQRRESQKKQSSPNPGLPVDHLIASSKLDSGTEPVKSQVHFYTRAKSHCSSRAPSSKKLPMHYTIATKPEKVWPPLDSKLVLPLRETWYAVSITEVLKANGSFDILRMTGCPSLRATIKHLAGSNGVLELFCPNGGRKQFLACASRVDDSATLPSVTLTGAGEKDLGQLKLISSRCFELRCNDDLVMSLGMNEDGQLEVLSGAGNQLGCVSCAAGHLGICINARADTGLIICLVLTAVLLGGAGEHVLPKGLCTEGRSAEDACENDDTSPDTAS